MTGVSAHGLLDHRRLPAPSLEPLVVRPPMRSTSRPLDSRNRSRREALLCRIRGEFLEMPGISLTLPQARRLFGVDEDVCTRILDGLVLECVLMRTSDGRYRRRDVW